MFERFSSGYYLGRLYVQPRETQRAAIASAAHEQVAEQLYETDGVYRTDQPLVMKLGTTHFTVTGDEGVPAETLALPESLVADLDIRNPPTLSEVFLAKADRARQLLSVAEGLPAVGSDATSAGEGDDSGDSGGFRPGDPFDGPDGPAGI
jgi:hypothetical protein